MGDGMGTRCAYCGMMIKSRSRRARIDGGQLEFCSARCLALFRHLGARGRLKLRIQSERAEILTRMEEKRGTRALTLVHRREPWSAEAGGYITIEDSEALVAQIRRPPNDRPIDRIIHTPGGIALAAEMIAMAARRHPAKVTAIVPFYSMSGGSLIALAADEIQMERDSILGPLDPQIGGFPARSLITLPVRKPIETVSDQMVVLSEVARRSQEQVREFVKWLLEETLPAKNREGVAEFFTGGFLSHDTPIVAEVIRELGLHVTVGIPDEVYELFRTYEFGTCARPQCAAY